MKDDDQLLRFTFENCHVRGEITRVKQSLKTILESRNYPEPVQHLLAEVVAAVSLLSATIKFDGLVVLQARGSGPITTLMAECSNSHQVRAIARWHGNIDSQERNLKKLLGEGQLAITIIPENGKRYQGIVPLEDGYLAQCLETYFRQSEQLSTRIWLCSNIENSTAAGFLLQEMPLSENATTHDTITHDPITHDEPLIHDELSAREKAQKDWEHLTHIAATLTEEELLQLDFDTLLHRLYHQDPIRLHSSTPIQFHCSCSRERTAQALIALGKDELKSLSDNRKKVTINCQFCNESYIYDRVDIAELIENGGLTIAEGNGNIPH